MSGHITCSLIQYLTHYKSFPDCAFGTADTTFYMLYPSKNTVQMTDPFVYGNNI